MRRWRCLSFFCLPRIVWRRSMQWKLISFPSRLLMDSLSWPRTLLALCLKTIHKLSFDSSQRSVRLYQLIHIVAYSICVYKLLNIQRRKTHVILYANSPRSDLTFQNEARKWETTVDQSWPAIERLHLWSKELNSWCYGLISLQRGVEDNEQLEVIAQLVGQIQKLVPGADIIGILEKGVLNEDYLGRRPLFQHSNWDNVSCSPRPRSLPWYRQCIVIPWKSKTPWRSEVCAFIKGRLSLVLERNERTEIGQEGLNVLCNSCHANVSKGPAFIINSFHWRIPTCIEPFLSTNLPIPSEWVVLFMNVFYRTVFITRLPSFGEFTFVSYNPLYLVITVLRDSGDQETDVVVVIEQILQSLETYVRNPANSFPCEENLTYVGHSHGTGSLIHGAFHKKRTSLSINW